MQDSTQLATSLSEHRVESRLTPRQQDHRDALVAVVRDFQSKSIEAACALAEIKRQRLYFDDGNPQGNFVEFARRHFGYSKTHAYDLAQAGKLYAAFDEAGVDPLPTSEAQVRPLTKLTSLSEQRTAWERAVGNGAAHSTTMEDVLSVVREMLGETISDVAAKQEATAGELRALAPDEIEAGRMLRRLREHMDDDVFEHLVRERVGRGLDWAERAMNYAETCDHLEQSARPSIADFERHTSTLQPLALVDRQAVWERLSSGPAKPKAYSSREVALALREVLDETLEELGLDPVADPPTVDDLVAGRKETAETGTHRRTAGPIELLLDVSLIENDALRATVEAAGTFVLPDTVRLRADAVNADDREAATMAIVEGMQEKRDLRPDVIKSQTEAAKQQGRLVEGQRKMVRVGFEPDLATWAWPVLTPSALRFPRAWLPSEGAIEHEPPCFVPRRLLQPQKTRRRRLSAEKWAEREAGTYYVDDDERYQSRVVLLAPGVDLTLPAIPDDVVGRVLHQAGSAEEFVFLALAWDVDRLSSFEWPGNVRPVVHASTPTEAERAVAAFARAGTVGILLLRDLVEPLVVGRRTEGPGLVVEDVEGFLAAVLVRGEGTTRRALQSTLSLRSHGVRVQIHRSVTVRAVEPVFDPRGFGRSADANGSSATPTPQRALKSPASLHPER